MWQGILGGLVGDVDGTMGSGGISGGLSVVFTVFQTKGGWVTCALSPSGWRSEETPPSLWGRTTLLECVYDLSIIGTSLP